MRVEKHLLVVEGDPVRAHLQAQHLHINGYAVSVVTTGREALEVLERQAPSLLLLSVNLPDIGGIQLLEHIRRFSSIPIIMFGDENYPAAKVRSLETGADDFLTYPYHEEELLARIAALLRRMHWTPPTEAVLQVGQLRVEMSHRRAMLGGKMLHLTPIEFAILCTLMQRAGQLVTYQELMQSVWGNSGESDSSVLRVNISRLRQKIEDDADRPRYILTVPRQGYRMPG